MSNSNYKFKKNIPSKSNNGKFSYALFEDERRNKAFAKICSNKLMGSSHYWLSNEASVYRCLSLTKLPKANVKVPKYVKYIYPDTLLTEYINHPKASALSQKEQSKAIISCLTFIAKLNSKKFTPKIIIRSRFYWVLLLPYITTAALVCHPRLFQTIAKAVIYLLTNLSKLVTDKTMKFVHRDLRPDNILVAEHTYWILDFQLASMTNPMVEYAVALLENWENEIIKKYLIDKYTNNDLFRFFVVYFALYDLGSAKPNPVFNMVSSIKKFAN
jgi:serine/threonine protein kinase